MKTFLAELDKLAAPIRCPDDLKVHLEVWAATPTAFFVGINLLPQHPLSLHRFFDFLVDYHNGSRIEKLLWILFSIQLCLWRTTHGHPILQDLAGHISTSDRLGRSVKDIYQRLKIINKTGQGYLKLLEDLGGRGSGALFLLPDARPGWECRTVLTSTEHKMLVNDLKKRGIVRTAIECGAGKAQTKILEHLDTLKPAWEITPTTKRLLLSDAGGQRQHTNRMRRPDSLQKAPGSLSTERSGVSYTVTSMATWRGTKGDFTGSKAYCVSKTSGVTFCDTAQGFILLNWGTPTLLPITLGKGDPRHSPFLALDGLQLRCRSWYPGGGAKSGHKAVAPNT